MSQVQPVVEISQRLAARNAAQRYYVYKEDELTDDELHIEVDEDFPYNKQVDADPEQIEGYAEDEEVKQIEGAVPESATPEEEN